MILKIWRENKRPILLFFVSFAAVIAAVAAFFTTGGDNLFLFIMKILAIINFIYWLRVFVKILTKYGFTPAAKVKKSKVWRVLSRIFDVLFDAIAKAGKAVKNKTGSIFGKLIPNRGSVLRRYNDERSFVFGGRNRIGSKLRKMRWRNLSSNRERVRYIYISFLKKQIKSGADVSLADTPNELYEKLQEKGSDIDSRLFSLYNLARYKDDESSIIAEDVENIRRKR
ncbi:MAG: hypothetical protein FWC32_07815 [Firmicutes bacterium]|nr:hypothetical protein [Bacillota bacterium]